MEKKLEGKTAIITGSDSGIGQATAIEFARNGANVIINYLHDEDGAEYTLQQVMQTGQQGLVIQADMSDEQQVEEMFDRAIEQFGDIFILMNNAAVGEAETKVAEMSTEQWQRAFAVNVNGYFFCARRFVQHRLQQGGKGKIINVTSVHQRLPREGAADYTCTKGAVMNLSRTLALEVAAQGINVNNLAPGMVLTPFNQEAIDDPEAREKQVQSIPMKRAAQPEEIAKLALFLASPDSDYCSGATYTMDGALSQHVGQGA
ncbi:glucose 1-dehydrogenase [Pontibacter akesuensis]|uniref:Glucose 1-dehydrogenase n=1 Tax=Pontibacter akesuensis TaxID=388950 RepID=A0A1I7GS35_9BACT|nr:glucose 1-dehydrogenase [Pontibacter akesuensis]GHA55380.1 glucose 1-dehydrogenase 2 [Pontibacter akesuensis]SFU51229.1 glucose 1-dehydrogenase [Pontibacter akesuensis]